MIGLTSVTFRHLSADKIIRLACDSGIDGIEWGSDIHVPEGQYELAKEIGSQTKSCGLSVLSYGSYYRLCRNSNPAVSFRPYLESAKHLNAPNIRIWAGEKSPSGLEESEYEKAACELSALCAMAREYGITISTEYHRGTLTETAESTLKLIKMADEPNLATYWQPNPDISHAQNCEELELVRPFLKNVHVFEWRGKNIAFPLKEGARDWRDYMNIVNAGKRKVAWIMEFVKGDSPEQFAEDAKTLLSWQKEQSFR